MLLIVSNRLPITVFEKDGNLKFQQSVGGLVSGLSAYLDSLKGSSLEQSQYIWIGWPGTSISPKAQERLKLDGFAQFQAHPVYISEKMMDKFYHGFCNKTLWPLFHYFREYSAFDEEYWKSYVRVNEIFCEAVLERMNPGDVVWVQDYHLMLLPQMIRERVPDAPIAFFLHIPFPSFEIFRLIPSRWRRGMLEGLLGSDLIGFHTQEYAQYFLRCVLRILGHEHTGGRITMKDRIVKVGAFPMGIDFQKFQASANSPAVKEERKKLERILSGFKTILSVDRLDYSKGIVNRLQGYEILLERNPQWRGKVTLIVVVVPSRVAVEQYRQMKIEIETAVGRINGRFGTIGWTPVIYQYRFTPFQPLVALYSLSDVALVTPLRDGMNLIAKEYVASRTDGTGVLILSEMAGAARELGEAILINPNDREEIRKALEEALAMPVEEQRRRNQIMQSRLRSHDVVHWADQTMKELHLIKDVQKRFYSRIVSPEVREEIMHQYRISDRRLIFLDYDGTLIPFSDDPLKAVPEDEVLELLRALAADRKLDLVLISGRSRETLQEWFGGLPISLVAEHGVWVRERDRSWSVLKQATAGWKPEIASFLQEYVERLPGSFIEEKEYSIAWHYRAADPEVAAMRARELVDDLVSYTANMDLHVLRGNKVVEVRNAGVDKGNAGLHWLRSHAYPFVMAIGDDWTDEDLFKVLPQSAYSIRVGITSSQARFYLRDPEEVLQLLRTIVEEREKGKEKQHSLFQRFFLKSSKP